MELVGAANEDMSVELYHRPIPEKSRCMTMCLHMEQQYIFTFKVPYTSNILQRSRVITFYQHQT